MLGEFVGLKVVVDCRSEFVALGTLVRFDDAFVELKNADLHDLRDTRTDRENYVVACVRTGVKRNRKRVLLSRTDIVAVALLADVTEE